MNDIDMLETVVRAHPEHDVPALMLADELATVTTATLVQAHHHVATIRAHADGSAQLAEATHLLRPQTNVGTWLLRRVRWMAGLARTHAVATVVLVTGCSGPLVTTKLNNVGAWSGPLTVTVGAEWVLRQWYARREQLTARALIRGKQPPRFASHSF